MNIIVRTSYLLEYCTAVSRVPTHSLTFQGQNLDCGGLISPQWCSIVTTD
ncbi:hypothetical protein AAS21_gp109 [Pantoea phage vB_PagS_AAS21]|uniref:Uncharacterized protein n=1 Tax=Pantoea phage vB_PagS_AAS21 TaxID=2575261 RepID=A0A4Y5P1M5_9CAUD|nr:hypothetical protein AAS21_gp109 [Pantoea phage vB_PagS_AAS21]